MAMACLGKLGVRSQTWTGSQQWAVWWCCHPEQLWCPMVPEALAACIIATVFMTLAFCPLLAFPGHIGSAWCAWFLIPITHHCVASQSLLQNEVSSGQGPAPEVDLVGW